MEDMESRARFPSGAEIWIDSDCVDYANVIIAKFKAGE
jgi:hypothetical protein